MNKHSWCHVRVCLSVVPFMLCMFLNESSCGFECLTLRWRIYMNGCQLSLALAVFLPCLGRNMLNVAGNKSTEVQAATA